MKSMKLFLLASLAVMGSLSMTQAQAQSTPGAVFAMTNAANGNQILAYTRQANGTLSPAGSYSTEGNGNGGAVDPLASQGSLRLSADHRFLFAVNAGSDTITTFYVNGSALSFIRTVPSGGTKPVAIAQAGPFVYVLNQGSSTVSAFLQDFFGNLWPLPYSTKALSGANVAATSLAISPDLQFLVVTEKATNNVDVFRILGGYLSQITVNPGAGAAPFAPLFAPNGALTVAEAGTNSISSYSINWNGTLNTLTAALPSDGKATCWSVIDPALPIVYTANAGTSNLSGFTIQWNGKLAPLPGTIAGSNVAGATNLDIATSADGKFLYSLNTGNGTIGIFSIANTGALTALPAEAGLPVQDGINGIAAY